VLYLLPIQPTLDTPFAKAQNPQEDARKRGYMLHSSYLHGTLTGNKHLIQKEEVNYSKNRFLVPLKNPKGSKWQNASEYISVCVCV